MLVFGTHIEAIKICLFVMVHASNPNCNGSACEHIADISEGKRDFIEFQPVK